MEMRLTQTYEQEDPRTLRGTMEGVQLMTQRQFMGMQNSLAMEFYQNQVLDVNSAENREDLGMLESIDPGISEFVHTVVAHGSYWL